MNITTKKKARAIKIFIHTDNKKINLIPIPFFMARGLISFLSFTFRLIGRSSDNSNMKDVKEYITIAKLLIKDIKQLPPFEIINIQNKDTTIIIKTK